MRRTSAPYLTLLFATGAACSAHGNSSDDPPDSGVHADAPAQPDAPAGADFCNATDPRTVPIVTSPTPEDSETPYLDVLTTAQHTIDVAIYEMGEGGILDTLEAKARAGVAVRVILDTSEQSVNQPYATDLMTAGAQIEWSSSAFTYFHNKYFVVDGRAAVMSTGNFSKEYSIDLERNFVLTDTDPADVADLETLFTADWGRTVPAMTCTRMVISPVNARARLLAVIDGATTTLDIESMQFADTEVRQHVAARVAAGVTVRAILADPSWITENADAATYLKGLGVPVKSIPHMHTKVLTADGVVAYVGSENLSETSLDHNREVGAVLVEQSSIDPLVTTYTKDWDVGSDL